MNHPGMPTMIEALLPFLDPVLIVLAVWFGWKADQAAKLIVAVIAALVASVLVGWAAWMMGLPWPAPVGGDRPLLLQSRSGAAIFWSLAAFLLRRVLRP